jgi:RNA polymerase sigma-70 factor (ECF subfamily)
VVEAETALQSESYSNYLMSLARIQLARAGPVQRKIESADLVQDVLLQAHAARAQFRGTTSEELAAWLRQILANKLADVQKHFGRGKRDAALEATYRDSLDASAVGMVSLAMGRLPTPTSNLAHQQRVLLLADALQELPQDQRTAVELRYLADYSLTELAAHLQRSKPSVAGLLRRGLKSLREILGPASL